MPHSFVSQHAQERGSILLYILLGIVLVGALTVAIRNSNNGGADNIDKEDMVLKANQVQKYGDELASAVNILLSNGLSEADIRFAHDDAPTEYGDIDTDPDHQVFDPKGGKATYKQPPAGVNDGSPWEFFGDSRIPEVGSDRAELIAVLPNVTEDFCKVIDSQLGFNYSVEMPTDDSNGSTPDCVMGSATDRFTGSFSDISPNLLKKTSFSRLPALQACVKCDSGGTYNYYYVLLSR